ncbi:MAG TPA: multicopper oxidase family protein [Casimicrobiaceae bacterium]
MSIRSLPRRRALRALATLAAWPATRAGLAQQPPPAADLCANGTTFDTPLARPGTSGFMGYYTIDSAFDLRAGAVAGGPAPLAYSITGNGAQWHSPILVAETGTRVRATLTNALDEPTIVHWHGLTIDSANDGNGDTLAMPGAHFDYAFALRNRAGVYWYHPHPQGLTAGQIQCGLFGVLLVDDAEDRALGKALATRRGDTDLVLALSDRRASARGGYAPSAADRVGGYLGDEMLVNGTPRAWLDVGSRGYRLRVLNASNARTFRLAFRGDDGKLLAFTLLGTDGGLLAQPLACRELFLASAERIDVWVDFAGRATGDSVVLESLAFDPMHGEAHGGSHAPVPDAADPHAGHGDAPHVGPSDAPHAAGGDGPHAAQGVATTSAIGDGARLSLLQFRIRQRVAATPAPPPTLSALAAPRVGGDDAVPFRLSFAKSRWRINDRVFDMQGEPLLVPRNSVQTWLLRNYYTSMPHAMHLHGFSMRVLARETSPDFLAPLALDASGRLATDLGVKDTVLVWPGESVRVSIDFACAFPGPQDYLLHCHNLEHEDGGMMLRIRVV